jgi:hypothetical protein
LRVLAAAAVGLAVTLPAAPPADAADNDPYTAIAVDVLIGLLNATADGSLSPAEIAQLVQATINAVNGVKGDVVSRLDAQLVNELRAKVQAATTSVHYLNHPVLASIYLGQVNQAAHSAKSHVDTVSSDRDLDAVGRAMITLFSALEVTEAKLGLLQPTTRFADYREGLQNLINKMAPGCSTYFDPGFPMLGRRECTFNGKTVRAVQMLREGGPHVSIDGGPWTPGNLDTAHVEDLVMADTAEALAKNALEQLRLRGY